MSTIARSNFILFSVYLCLFFMCFLFVLQIILLGWRSKPKLHCSHVFNGLRRENFISWARETGKKSYLFIFLLWKCEKSIKMRHRLFSIVIRKKNIGKIEENRKYLLDSWRFNIIIFSSGFSWSDIPNLFIQLNGRSICCFVFPFFPKIH